MNPAIKLPNSCRFYKNGDENDVVTDGEYEMIFTPSTEGFTPYETAIRIKTRSSE